MKVYRGVRREAGAAVIVADDAGERVLDPRFDLHNHSPTGFEWGYGGSGPAQLALALAADTLGDDARARRVYQPLKFKLVAALQADTWTLTGDQVLAAIADAERAQARVASPPPAGGGRPV